MIGVLRRTVVTDSRFDNLCGSHLQSQVRGSSVLLITRMYGVPLPSKYPDIEMLFQKPKISRDVQNMMPKIITYRSRPKKKNKSSSSLFDKTRVSKR